MYIFYKYSDKGKTVRLNNRNINKQDFFLNLIKQFKGEYFYIFLDNCNETSINWFRQFNFNKYFISKVGIGGVFYNTLNEAIILNDEEIVYFVEDDYLHDDNSKVCLIEGINIADYVSLYDCPDKYINAKDGGNPLIEGGGETTKVLLTKSTHWKYTNSTAGTFASKVKTIKEDFEVFKKYIGVNSIGRSDFKDFLFFIDIINKGRKLVTPIPGKSSHIIDWFPYNTPLINWNEILKKIENERNNI